MASLLKTTLVAAALSLGASAASAQGAYGYDGYGASPVYAGDDGYARSAIRGDYVGAPLTRFPRPSELVPSAWGYGTYGVPTVSGIRQATVGTPTVYVIDAPAAVRRPGKVESRILSRNRDSRLRQSDGFRAHEFQRQEFRGKGFQERGVASGEPQARMASQAGARVVTVSVPR